MWVDLVCVDLGGLGACRVREGIVVVYGGNDGTEMRGMKSTYEGGHVGVTCGPIL